MGFDDVPMCRTAQIAEACHCQVAYVEDLPTRIGAYRCPSRPLSEASQRALRAKGFAKLFEHQAEAIDAATAGIPLFKTTIP